MSVYLRKGSSVYWMDFVLNGERVFKSTGETDHVRAMAREIIERERKGSEVATPKMTLSEAIDHCFEERWCDAADGKAIYAKAMKLVDYFDDALMGDITATDIIQMVRKMQEEGKAKGTINQHLTRLKTVFRMAVSWGVCPSVPSFPQIKRVEGRMRFLSKEEESQVIETLISAGEADVADLVAILLDTGMRLSEGLRVKVEDYDVDVRSIHVWKTKNGKARSVPMTNRVRTILLRRRSQRIAGEVFEGLTVTKVEHVWQKVRYLLSIDDDQFVLHALRHTFASRLAQKGYDLYKISKLLGHSSIKMTEIYAHLIPENVQGAATLLDEPDLRISNDFVGGKVHANHLIQ